MEDYKSHYLKLLKSVSKLNHETRELIAKMESIQKQYQDILLATIDELPAEILEGGEAI